MDDETTLDDETRPGIDAPADDAFTDHVTSPIHDDAGDEFAPFGTDEGLAQTAVHVSDSRLGAKT